jgi:hypothetical protein
MFLKELASKCLVLVPTADLVLSKFINVFSLSERGYIDLPIYAARLFQDIPFPDNQLRKRITAVPETLELMGIGCKRIKQGIYEATMYSDLIDSLNSYVDKEHNIKRIDPAKPINVPAELYALAGGNVPKRAFISNRLMVADVHFNKLFTRRVDDFVERYALRDFDTYKAERGKGSSWEEYKECEIERVVNVAGLFEVKVENTSVKVRVRLRMGKFAGITDESAPQNGEGAPQNGEGAPQNGETRP